MTIEAEGVQFIRFTDREVKKELFSVLLALEEKVRELVDEQESD